MDENQQSKNEYNMDLRGVACPMNFVKTKLFLDKLDTGSLLTVLVDAGEPVESVTSSIEAEGHKIDKKIECLEGHYSLTIRKLQL
jgi:TusA-related sulfurtransferase